MSPAVSPMRLSLLGTVGMLEGQLSGIEASVYMLQMYVDQFGFGEVTAGGVHVVTEWLDAAKGVLGSLSGLVGALDTAVKAISVV